MTDFTYLRRLMITLLVAALAYGTWQLSNVALLLFAAILVAVILDAIADLLAEWTPVPRGWSITVASLLVAALVIGLFVLFGTQLAAQLREVFAKLPEAIDAAGNRFGIDQASHQIEEALAASSGSNAFFRAAGIGYTLIGAIGNLVLVYVAAIYLAADPGLYRHGVVKLLPEAHHARALDAMAVAGNALKLWFGGQIITMAIIGVLSYAAYWWIGLPSPLALATIAGATNFVPFLGPILGAVPALVFSLAMDLETMLWTIAAVVVIQQVEGNVITPMIQQRTLLVPPVFVLFAILAFGALFGLAGVFLGMPMAVVAMILVQKLWIRETLGEETEVPGEETADVGPDPRERRAQ